MVTTHEAQPFIEALRARQLVQGLSGQQFASRLGISAGQWSRIVNDERKVTLGFIRAAVRAYPELSKLAESLFFTTAATVGNASVLTSTENAEATR